MSTNHPFSASGKIACRGSHLCVPPALQQTGAAGLAAEKVSSAVPCLNGPAATQRQHAIRHLSSLFLLLYVSLSSYILEVRDVQDEPTSLAGHLLLLQKPYRNMSIGSILYSTSTNKKTAVRSKEGSCSVVQLGVLHTKLF